MSHISKQNKKNWHLGSYTQPPPTSVILRCEASFCCLTWWAVRARHSLGLSTGSHSTHGHDRGASPSYRAPDNCASDNYTSLPWARGDVRQYVTGWNVLVMKEVILKQTSAMSVCERPDSQGPLSSTGSYARCLYRHLTLPFVRSQDFLWWSLWSKPHFPIRGQPRERERPGSADS